VIGRWLPAVLAALLAIGIGGCGGGGGGGGGGGTVADGGIGGTGISSGSITGMGSIFVNGRRFEIESAEITINGTPAMSSRLEVGYVVDVRADFDDGIAENVAFRPNLMARSMRTMSRPGPIPVRSRSCGRRFISARRR
jgi:hypothetical protein